MKKLYSFLAAISAVTTVWAGSPFEAKQPQALDLTNATIQPLETIEINGLKFKLANQNNNKFLAQHLVDINLLKSDRAKAKAKAKAPDFSNYTKLEGTRAINAALSTFSMTEVMDVDFYMHNTEVGQYAIGNMMKNSYYTSYFTVEDDIFEIDANDVDHVYGKVCDLVTFTGNYSSYGTIPLYSWAYYCSTYLGYTIDEMKASSDFESAFGTFKDNKITLPAGSMFAVINNQAYDIDEDFVIGFPGTKLYYSIIDSYGSYLTDDEDSSISVILNFDGDVTSAKFSIYDTYYHPGYTKIYDEVASSNSVATLTSPTMITIDNSFFKNESTGKMLDYHTLLTAVLVGLDSDGNAVDHHMFQFFYQPDESANWKSIGTGQYTDGFFSELISSSSSGTSLIELPSKVAMEEHVKYPGYVRIVNPYKNISKFADYLNTDNDYYLYIVNLEGKPIYIEPSVFGLSYYYGLGIGCSESYKVLLEGGTPDASTAGVYDTKYNEITFPKNTMLLGFPYFNDGQLDYSDSNGKFYLALPSSYERQSGVSDIVTNDSDQPVEYFNLQGVRISNPTPGQLVIRRQGGVSTKEILK